MIYLDNASTSFPKPVQVIEAVSEYMNGLGVNINRGCYRDAYLAEEMMLETREMICSLFHGPDCRNVVFTKNVTESLNILIKGLLKPGDHVLVSSMEHNAVMRPLVQLEKQGISFTRVTCDRQGMLDIEDLERCATPQTKAVIMTHASNVCGTVLPIEEIGMFCSSHGLLFIVDSAQTAGVLPLDMVRMHIDALAFTGHKGLLGPQGTGGFVITDELADRIDPLLSGGTGSMSHMEEIPSFLPDRFEPGTMNLPGIMGLRAGLFWLKDKGIDTVYAHELMLTRRFLQGLELFEDKGLVEIIGRHDIHSRVGVVSIQTRKTELSQAAYALDSKYGIMTRVGLHCAPSAHRTLNTYPIGTIRFSFGHANTERDVDEALSALEVIAHGF